MTLPTEWALDTVAERVGKAAAAMNADIRVWEWDSAKARSVRAGLDRQLRTLTWRLLRRQLLNWRREKTGTSVTDHYENSYASTRTSAFGDPAGRPSFFRLPGSHVIETLLDVVNLLSLQRLGDVIEALEPEDVTEIGSGMGRNVLTLANRFPALKLQGIELSHAGVARSQQMSALDLTQEPLAAAFGFGDTDWPREGRVTFGQGSAYDLPLADKSCDLVYTYQALEQMQANLPRALAEIRRVTRRWAVFYEPFSDFNDRAARAYLWAGNYFRVPTRSLSAHGFTPVAVYRAFPIKPTFAYGMVVAQVT